MTQRDMSGALFKNERKTAENQPDFQGKIVVNNEEWWVAAWVRKAQTSGKQYLSLAISEPRQQGSPVGSADSLLDLAKQPAKQDWGSGEVDDDIPF